MLKEKSSYKVAIYMRLSVEDKKKENNKTNDSESIKNQRILLTKYIRENGFLLVDEYVDDGYSGSNYDRPEFKKMINDIENGIINMVIVKDLSRLGRNNIETNEYVDRYFPQHRVRFVAVLDNVDTEIDTVGNEMAPFKILVNEYYNRITSKNIRATLKNKKSSGFFLGWKAPYGYKKSPDNKNKLIVDEESAKVVKRIFNLARDGNGPQVIANILSQDNIPTPSVYANLNRGLKSSAYNLWCARTIDEMLINQTYIGNLTQGRRKKIYGIKMEIRTPKEEWIIVENTHKPIIDKVTFEQVQQIRKKVSNRVSTQNNYLFKKILKCKECGHSLTIYRRSARNQAYTACSHYQKYSKFHICTPHTMNYNKLEEQVLNIIRYLCKEHINKNSFKSILENEEKYNNKYEKITNQINTFNNKISNYDKYFDDIYLDFKKNNITKEQYNRAKKRLEEEKNDIIKKIDDLKIILSSTKKITNTEKKYIEFVNEYLSFEKPTKELLSLLIDRIEIDKNKNIDIYFNFKL